jgi:hypothetical protein
MLITGRQCKSARALLKWNLRELEFRSTIRARVLEPFEKGTKTLLPSQREQLFKIFTDEGVVFTEHGEIRLEDTSKIKGKSHASHQKAGGSMQQETHYVDIDQLLALNQAQYQKPRIDTSSEDSPSLD